MLEQRHGAALDQVDAEKEHAESEHRADQRANAFAQVHPDGKPNDTDYEQHDQLGFQRRYEDEHTQPSVGAAEEGYGVPDPDQPGAHQAHKDKDGNRHALCQCPGNAADEEALVCGACRGDHPLTKAATGGALQILAEDPDAGEKQAQSGDQIREGDEQNDFPPMKIPRSCVNRTS